MGYNVQAYAVDLEKLRGLVGSNDEALIGAICDKYDRELSGIDDIDGTEPSARAAVAALIQARMDDGEVNFKYGYALELVCRELGQWLPNQHWSAMHGEWFDSVDDAFADLGGKSKLCSDVFWSGPPVDLPFIDDFPAIGTVPADRVAPLLGELEAALAKARPSQETSSLRELCEWLRVAQREGGGVVTFYY